MLPRIALSVVSILALISTSVVRADVPPLISYQSILRTTGGTTVPDGDYTVSFRLYTAPEGGAPVWEETRVVQTSAGVFHVLLGAVTPVPYDAFGGDLYLGIEVEPEAEMTPRVRLVSVGYAMAAQNAYRLEGRTAAELDQSGEITQAVSGLTDSIARAPFENVFRYYASVAGSPGAEFPAFTAPADKSRYITGVHFIPLPPGAADRVLTLNIGGSPVLILYQDSGMGPGDSWSSGGGAPLKVEPGESVSFVTTTAGTHTVLITGYEF